MTGSGRPRDEILARLVAANMRPGASDEERAVHRLILDAATDPARQLAAAELERVLQHIAGAGFDPLALERVRGNIVRLVRPDGREVQQGEYLPPAEAHYLRHCVARQEWPAGIGFAGYLAAIRQVIADPTSGVLVGRQYGVWQLTVVREARELLGPAGREWLVVEYRLRIGHWTTAHHLWRGLAQLDPPDKEDVR
jgi:hypothetical protein